MGIPYRGFAFNTSKPPFDDVNFARGGAGDRSGRHCSDRGFGEYAPKADFLAANTPDYDPAYRKVLHYIRPKPIACSTRRDGLAGRGGLPHQGRQTAQRGAAHYGGCSQRRDGRLRLFGRGDSGQFEAGGI